MKLTRSQIAAKVQGDSRFEIELVKGEGYWYFIANLNDQNGKTVFYENQSVYVMRLSDMSAQSWINVGEAFLAQCAEQAAERGVL